MTLRNYLEKRRKEKGLTQEKMREQMGIGEWKYRLRMDERIGDTGLFTLEELEKGTGIRKGELSKAISEYLESRGA